MSEGGAAPVVPFVGTAISIARNLRERREQRRERDREEQARAAAAAFVTATRAIRSETERVRREERMLPPRNFPLPRIATGERIPQGGVGTGGILGLPRLPRVPRNPLDAIGALLEILDLIFRRRQRRPRPTVFNFPPIFFPTSFPPQGGLGGGGIGMPNVSATLGESSFFGNRPGFDIGDIFGPNSVISRFLGGGGGDRQVVPQVPGFQGFGQLQELGQLPQISDGSVIPGTGCATAPFRAGAQATARASVFCLPNPLSGRPVWFMPAGRPLLWSGDVSAMRRVRRVASLAGRASGRRVRRRRGGR